MKWWGLTGGIATGKTTASKILTQHGVAVVDADEIVHDLWGSDADLRREAGQAFGREIFGADGALDRRALGARVFGQPEELRRLEQMIHPRVKRVVSARRSELAASGNLLAVYDVPLLFEKQLAAQFDGTLMIACSEPTQRARMRSRNLWSEQEIAERLAQQIPIEEKKKLATHVIQNEGTLAELEVALQNWRQRVLSNDF